MPRTTAWLGFSLIVLSVHAAAAAERYIAPIEALRCSYFQELYKLDKSENVVCALCVADDDPLISDAGFVEDDGSGNGTFNSRRQASNSSVAKFLDDDAAGRQVHLLQCFPGLSRLHYRAPSPMLLLVSVLYDS